MVHKNIDNSAQRSRKSEEDEQQWELQRSRSEKRQVFLSVLSGGLGAVFASLLLRLIAGSLDFLGHFHVRID